MNRQEQLRSSVHIGFQDTEEMITLKKDIVSAISDLMEAIQCVSPKKLLYELSYLEIAPHCFEDGTSAYSLGESGIRPTEYVQSLISVIGAGTLNDADSVDSHMAFNMIDSIRSLHSLCDKYAFYWGAGIDCGAKDESESKFLLEAQLYSMVRGKRYQAFEASYLESLIQVHNDALIAAFGVGSKEIVEGYKHLIYALSAGRFDAFTKLAELYLSKASEITNTEYYEKNKSIFDDLAIQFTPEQFDVDRITGWPSCLIEALSAIPGEEKWPPSNDHEYWPITQLPIQEKPFIQLEGRFYCFDYYSLVDNFYWSVKKALIRSGKETHEQWNMLQAQASEKAVEAVFKRLLPGCSTFVNNYYRDPDHKKNFAENDLIVCYDDVVLFVEVKGGAFPLYPPICDCERYVETYRDILGKADWQCTRTARYYESFAYDEVPFLDIDHNPKFLLCKRTVRDTYRISVTVENVNTFASRIEKIACLEAGNGTISLAIDDLSVYAEFFDSPLVFLHYLSKRRAAASNKTLAVNDELEHLGLYLSVNNYASIADEVLDDYPDVTEVSFDSFRDEIDVYFERFDQPTARPEKPSQHYPELYSEILDCLERKNAPGRVAAASYLLDFSEETREQFSSMALEVFSQLSQGGRVAHFTMLGNDAESIRCGVCVSIEGFFEMSPESASDYIRCQIVGQDEPDRTLIHLVFDAFGKVKNVSFARYDAGAISEDERIRLMNLWHKYADRRVARALMNRKIGRNEPCPCGSGKKFKKCHGC